MRRTLIGLIAGAALMLPAGGSPSVGLGTNPTRVTLRVNTAGFAEIGWTANGTRRYVLVPPRGRVLPGRRLPGRDVSRRYTRLTLPFQRALRRTPDGRLWAVQAWAAGGTGLDVRFSRWRGAPTEVQLQVSPTDVPRLTGRAIFHGAPVTGFSRTPAGTQFRHFAFIDCFGCAAGPPGQWTRIVAVAPRADGMFSVVLRPTWIGERYRATVTGPNRSTTLAPDGSALAETVRPPPP